MNKIFCINIQNIDLTEYYEYTHNIFSDKESYILKMIKQENRFKTFFIGHLLLRLILIHENIVATDEPILINYDAHGKPFIDSPKGIFFNISHSSSFIVIVYDKQSVGIDIQKQIKLSENILVRLFDFPIEKLDNFNISKDHLTTICWSIKESIGKADGKGLALPLKKLSKKDVITILSTPVKKIFSYHVFSQTLFSDYCLAVASHKHTNYKIVHLSPENVKTMVDTYLSIETNQERLEIHVIDLSTHFNNKDLSTE